MKLQFADMDKKHPGTAKLREQISPIVAGAYFFICDKQPTERHIARLRRIPWVETVVVDGKWVGVQLDFTRTPSGYGDVFTDPIPENSKMHALIRGVVKDW